MKRKILLPLVLLLLGASALQAQKPPAAPPAAAPGLVSLDELGLFPRDKLSVEINLEGALLHLVAAATRKDDPAFASMVDGLRSINVQVFPLEGGKEADEAAVKARIGRAQRWLEDRGWKANVRVREKGEETYIYLKEQEGKIVGLTLLSFQPGDEATVINIAGRIDPEQLGRLGQTLHVPELEKAPTAGRKP